MEKAAVNHNNPSAEEQNPQVLLDQLRAAVDQKEERIQSLEHQLNWFKRQLFGEKSEKRDMMDNPYQ